MEDGRQVTGHIGSGAQASRREGTSVADTASGTSTQRGGASTGGPSALRRDGAPRRTRVVLRKIGPWSILKFSLLFYFCVMLVVLVAMYILYAVMDALGTLDSLVKLLTEFSLVNKGFQLHTAWIFERLFVFGVLLVILWSIINVFAIFLYNLISDVVGGIEITLAEKR